MAEIVGVLGVILLVAAGVILGLRVSRAHSPSGLGSRAAFDPQEREQRQACQEEWNSVVLFMFPYDPWSARGVWQWAFERWYREWQATRMPAYLYWIREFGEMGGWEHQLRQYPEWVRDGAPNPLTWVSKEGKERQREWDERMRQLRERDEQLRQIPERDQE